MKALLKKAEEKIQKSAKEASLSHDPQQGIILLDFHIATCVTVQPNLSVTTVVTLQVTSHIGYYRVISPTKL